VTVIDWRELPTHDGFSLRAEKIYDEDSRPSDYECYTPKQVAAWERDEWEFVGLVVTASVENVELGSSSLWSIESGRFVCTDDNDNVTEIRNCDPLYDGDYINEISAEAVAVARNNLARINEVIV